MTTDAIVDMLTEDETVDTLRYLQRVGEFNERDLLRLQRLGGVINVILSVAFLAHAGEEVRRRVGVVDACA